MFEQKIWPKVKMQMTALKFDQDCSVILWSGEPKKIFHNLKKVSGHLLEISVIGATDSATIGGHY